MVHRVVWRLIYEIWPRQPEDSERPNFTHWLAASRVVCLKPRTFTTRSVTALLMQAGLHVKWCATFLSPQQPDSARYTTCSRSPNLGTPIQSAGNVIPLASQHRLARSHKCFDLVHEHPAIRDCLEGQMCTLLSPVLRRPRKQRPSTPTPTPTPLGCMTCMSL